MTPTLLLILDGWGLTEKGEGNAPWVAATPHLDDLMARCPHSRLAASGREVGLPAGYMGNSEVGHLNIGAGRIVYQDMTRIDVALEDGSLFHNPVLQDVLEKTRRSGGRLHLAGLLSDGGVHSHINHLVALCAMAFAAGVPVRIHCFMDGRDTPPQSGASYVRSLLEQIVSMKDVRVVSLAGRFYAMDRDKRWERVSEVWDLMVHGKGRKATDAVQAVEDSYAEGVSDEFIKPVLLEGEDASTLQDGDGLFFYNFRADRMRELSQAFVDADFTAFERGRVPQLAAVASMTAYDAHFPLPVAFPKESVTMGLGEVVSQQGMHQLRLAETEKYAHVTYFFNGGVEEPLPLEDRILVPSPREVQTYDQKPAMSAREVTDKFVEAWQSGQYDLVVCNLANGDMVGHTGVLSAAVEACTVVDECVGRMVAAVEARKGRMLLIADHGNCEVMKDGEGKPQTAHTTNPVPCILLDASGKEWRLHDGKLADVAPTLLRMWGIAQPEAMTGTPLVEEAHVR
ncbi:2,3-bisphosphoglycerate-independent phosphoglycerate mutase [Desulfovibrio sp.]|uniref:2,3-bisphosphoglycerate-independent phosphoglycerate mutase n=1 Tax=Desulfovibrio sp. TaxID=885 RepID=UPI002A755CA5|nr:2,3-bisphosphoglycerate-independent phosphoglycerate mutase [Desulfovibrio sp.]MDY2666139.1 2,3-bisphosphoglycerate-independent phosphoglycerate mutase [Desulfovibrio sp.]